jgi:uncharacterized protein with von Willebrand factor type A (vWA) domain
MRTGPPTKDLMALDPVIGSVLAGNVIAFARLLRRLGLRVDPGHTRLFLEALQVTGLGHRSDAKAAGRAVFVRRREELAPYDAAFDMFWRRSTVKGGVSPRLVRMRQHTLRANGNLATDSETMSQGESVDVVAPATTSDREVLRTADFAELTAEEARDVEAMLVALRPSLPTRPSRRRVMATRGERLAMRHMMRRALQTGGDPVEWRWLRRPVRPRPIVLVADISGSMERYSKFLMRFGHGLAQSGAPVEVFVFATRLTRITRELRVRNPDVALKHVARKVVDWDGGTRIGKSVRALNRRWVRRTIRSGAIVMLASDGWERGDPELLGREMAILKRSCHRLIWLDPLADRPGFEPATGGLRAALPHVDAFLPCATVASLEELAKGLARLSFGDHPWPTPGRLTDA